MRSRPRQRLRFHRRSDSSSGILGSASRPAMEAHRSTPKPRRVGAAGRWARLALEVGWDKASRGPRTRRSRRLWCLPRAFRSAGTSRCPLVHSCCPPLPTSRCTRGRIRSSTRRSCGRAFRSPHIACSCCLRTLRHASRRTDAGAGAGAGALAARSLSSDCGTTAAPLGTTRRLSTAGSRGRTP